MMIKEENSLKNYRDLKSVIDTAFSDGKTEVAKNDEIRKRTYR